MTHPPTYPTPPAGGQPPAGPTPLRHAVPAQHAPSPYAGTPAHPSPPPGYPPHPGWVPPPLAPNGQPLASFADRLLALLVDAAIIVAVSMVVVLPAAFAFTLWMMSGLTASAADGRYITPDLFGDFLLPLLALEAGIFLFTLGVTYVFHVEMMFKTGQTVGKRMMKLRVVPLDPALPLGRKAAAKRWLAHQVGGSFIPGFSYVDGLWQLWDKPWQQCLHDKFARTVVVKVAP
ncbi:RDD family protein [Micromonospora olivasterospora]|uniref:Putative RDD family membrane protein YckC n=1 Tax=Micromonospora olivasterospora TaxID=1880 RepID=A0A562I869_MICOL|nr:RDD family protein [Micromonospora olivasterospora]TWH66925.1 putative RDD family membrane protein YckC [Micromonospora olivasterospora]